MANAPRDRGLDICARVATLTDTIVLKFSGGKDSVGMWLRCQEFFPTILPLYHYWCPGLGFVERTLTRYEEFFQARIYRVPHPNFLNFQAAGAYQWPHRMPIFHAYNLGRVTYDHVVTFFLEDLGLLGKAWIAIGIKAFDSPIRQRVIDQYGAWSPARRLFYPVCDLRHQEVYALLEAHHCPLSEDYQVFGRSFDGFQPRYLKAVKEHYPEDFATLCQYFPLLPAEFMRAEAYATQKKG